MRRDTKDPLIIRALIAECKGTHLSHGLHFKCATKNSSILTRGYEIVIRRIGAYGTKVR